MKKYIVFAALCVYVFSACHSNHNHEDHDHGHGHESEFAHEHELGFDRDNEHNEIVLSPERAAEAGVKTCTVTAGDFSEAIRTSGVILPSGEGEITIIAKTSGVLTWVGATPAPGTRVKAGEPLAYVSAEGMGDGDAVRKTAIALEAATREYERAKTLREGNIVSEKDFNRIEAEYLTAKAALPEGYSHNGLAITPTASGRIRSILKSAGEYVSAGDPIAIVVKDGRLRLQADLPVIYSKIASSVKDAMFRPAGSDKSLRISTLSGKLTAVAPAVESGSAYLPITFEFDNADAGTIPGTFAEVWLVTGIRSDVISLPETVLIDEQGEFFAYVRLDEECYRKVPVMVGGRNGMAVEILSGVKNGDEVVVEGTWQVKVSSASSVIPGHSHNH